LHGKLQSKYGQLPATGTEGLNWYSFQEFAARSGKRLLSYGEWCRAAYGNPGGEDGADNYGWTKTSNTARTRTGCNVNASTGAYTPAGGIKPYAVSAHNLVDTVGNVWEWVDELTIRQVSTSWAWQDVLGADKGKAYLPNNVGMSAFVCGGNWSVGVICGGRAVSLNSYPWVVNSHIGSRLACDKLAS
jgi:formylglycine-generating enzyme required for sulfatase activity